MKLKTLIDAHQVIKDLLDDQAELMSELCLHDNALYNKRYKAYRELRRQSNRDRNHYAV
jgi:hypothetical protein